MGSINCSEPVKDNAARSTPTFQEVCTEALKILQRRQQRAADEFKTVVEFDRMIEHRTHESQQSAVSSKNRYVNVLPYDHNRVKLLSAAPDYINASHVAQRDQLGFECKYIATQGPLQATTADFWEMVYEQRVPVIIMLTNLIERGVNKCSAYFPVKLGDKLVKGNFEVQVEDLQTKGTGDQITLRTLKIVHLPSNQPHVVNHIHYHSWPDHGTPEDCRAIRAMSEQLDSCRDSKLPVVVHCSAGIGRTGTFCAIDILRQRIKAMKTISVELEKLPEQFDLVQLVRDLRKQRMGMVQTLEQYNFCYHAIQEELLQQQQSTP